MITLNYLSGDSWLSRRAEISKTEEFRSSFNDKSLFHDQDFDLDVMSPRWSSATTIKNDLSRRGVKLYGIRQGDSTGEVIYLVHSPAFGEDLFIATFSSFSPTLLDIEKEYAARNSGINKWPSSLIRKQDRYYLSRNMELRGKVSSFGGIMITKPHKENRSINYDDLSILASLHIAPHPIKKIWISICRCSVNVVSKVFN
ncbi:protein SHORTAGE IN CHIASMATA 1-like [Salvia divinorum]|uniref:Protein SHORTAGE IN CHIASMATA 1-like n=1 Tax=Salvia divinorum TaxID=28513 RepID=A0ABD1HFP3_SALDI